MNPCKGMDKRTKKYKECVKSEEYKRFKANFEKENSTGLGDVVDKITTATGIKKAVKFIAGEDCGCKERKDKWNKIRLKVRECPSEDDYNYMKWFLARKSNKVTGDQQRRINDILNKSLGTRYQRTSCASCFQGRVNQLQKLYDAYSQD
jgi:hypothetical protein